MVPRSPHSGSTQAAPRPQTTSIAAAPSLALYGWLLQTGHMPAAVISRYVAPVTEETAKALPLAVLIDSDASRVALPAIAGAAGTIALAVVTVRLSIGNGNTRIGCASLIAVAGFHT